MMRALLSAFAMLVFAILPAQAQFSLPRADVQLSVDCDDCPTMVTLPSGLRMSEAHVTRAQFEVFADETGYKRTTWGCAWNFPGIEQEENQPAVCISFDDAQAYLEWLSARAGMRYRLPTIEEYRAAASGGQIGNYWWGQDVGEGRANCIGCKTGADGKGTTAAGTFAPNPYGLLDALGNAWQWTEDCKDTDCTQHALIGGSWSSPPADLRLTKVIYADSPIPFYTYGLRVVTDDPARDTQ
jgi:formylglycine-generating enzyme required for sulfatase activity